MMREQDRRLILVNGRPYMRWAVDDTLMERIAVAQLCEFNMGSQQEIAAAFRTSIRSVREAEEQAGGSTTRPAVCVRN